jgi:hypothetical protein
MRQLTLSNVRFGSKADIASIKWDVRFTPTDIAGRQFHVR